MVTTVPVTEHHEIHDLLAGLGLQAVPEGRYLPEWKGQFVQKVAQSDLLEATDLMPWKTQALMEQDAQLRLQRFESVCRVGPAASSAMLFVSYWLFFLCE